MPSAQDAVEAVASTPYARDRLRTDDFDQSAAVPNEETTIAEVKPKRAFTVRPDVYDLDIPAYESFPSDSTSGDTDSFDLGHYPMESPGAVEQVVVYAGSDRVPVSEYSVDFSAGTLEYTGAETADDLHVWYFSEQQAQVRIRKVSPSGTFEYIDRADLSLLNALNTNEDPHDFDLDHALQGVIPAYWTLQLRVDAPYPVRWEVSTGDGGTATADQMLADVPINRARDPLPDWVEDVVGAVAGAQ